MTKIKETIEEIVLQENQADAIIQNAKAYAESLKLRTEQEIEKKQNELKNEAKKKVSVILDTAKQEANQKADEIITNAHQRADVFKQKASENVDDVSDYVIRKLKIKYGNR